jgi:hypothetical protein
MGQACCAHTSTSEGEIKSQVHLEHWIVMRGSGCKSPCGDTAIVQRRPIFDILLDHVHICVLHIWNMIIEKVVHMHFMHVWTIGDVALQKNFIDEMLRVVSLTGAHGRNVVLFKDQDLYRKANNIPNRPLLVVRMQRNYSEINLIDTSLVTRMLYVDVVNAKKNSLYKG